MRATCSRLLNNLKRRRNHKTPLLPNSWEKNWETHHQETAEEFIFKPSIERQQLNDCFEHKTWHLKSACHLLCKRQQLDFHGRCVSSVLAEWSYQNIF